MENVLITGATGFIGNRLRKLLEISNIQITIVSRKKHEFLKTIICDFENEQIPGNALDSIDTIFHIAGFAHDMRSDDKVKTYYEKINVDSTVQLANKAVASEVKRFIFVSSVKAGITDSNEIESGRENQNKSEGVYGKTKREAELKLLKIGSNSNMHITIIRPALVYGPSVKGNLKIMMTGIQKGWFPPIPKTNNQRSMIHVDDLAKALVFVSKKPITNGQIYIATDGVDYSTREIYETMCKITNKPIPKWAVPKILFEAISYLSPTLKYKVNKLLGDECYSSKKLKSLGFNTELTLRNMNETSF